jgi:hypothetical protein
MNNFFKYALIGGGLFLVYSIYSLRRSFGPRTINQTDVINQLQDQSNIQTHSETDLPYYMNMV